MGRGGGKIGKSEIARILGVFDSARTATTGIIPPAVTRSGLLRVRNKRALRPSRDGRRQGVICDRSRLPGK